jgi:outer membrane murein-binding lipoprotein Lpp
MPEANDIAVLQRLDKNTLINLSAAIALVITLSGAIWYGATKNAELGYLQGRVDRLESRIIEQSAQVAQLSSRQGVNEGQYQAIKESTNEIKEDIKRIQQALRISP